MCEYIQHNYIVINSLHQSCCVLQVVVPSAKAVADLQPDFDAIEKCPGMGIIVTGIAPQDSGFDFHSRYFCPKFGINEVINKLVFGLQVLCFMT